MHCASVPLKERHMQAFLWHAVAYGIVQRMFNVKNLSFSHWPAGLAAFLFENYIIKKRKFFWPGVGMFQELS